MVGKEKTVCCHLPGNGPFAKIPTIIFRSKDINYFYLLSIKKKDLFLVIFVYQKQITREVSILTTKEFLQLS